MSPVKDECRAFVRVFMYVCVCLWYLGVYIYIKMISVSSPGAYFLSQGQISCCQGSAFLSRHDSEIIAASFVKRKRL